MLSELDPVGGRVLVVEDDEDIADVLRRSLRNEGYEVRTSADGVEALDVAAGFIPDLVVLDLGLPGMDGVEVCRRLRSDGDVPILMLTARAETEDRVTGLDLRSLHEIEEEARTYRGPTHWHDFQVVARNAG